MTEQDKKLLKVYNLLGGRIIQKLEYLDYINDEFYDTDDELKIKLANKLEQAYLHSHNDVPIDMVSAYMCHLATDEDMSMDALLGMNDSELGNGAFDYYYMSL